MRSTLSCFVMLAVCLAGLFAWGATNAFADDLPAAERLLLAEELQGEDNGLLQGEEALAFLAAMQTERYTEVPEHGVYARGVTAAELMRDLGLVAVVLALVILVTIQFVDISRNSYRWSLLIALFILPFITALSAMTTTMEETKTVASCQSCHVMDPFVDDMLNPQSNTLAARHYENRWIPKQQCYECHTSYGVHGTLAGKRDGLRHWLLYVTNTYPEPITYAGSYPNANCTACHADTPAYEAVASHASLASELATDQVTCTACHGPPHPLPGERYPHADTPDDLTALLYHGIE